MSAKIIKRQPAKSGGSIGGGKRQYQRSVAKRRKQQAQA